MIRSFIVQAIIFIVAFHILSFFRESSMLSTGVSLPTTQTQQPSVSNNEVQSTISEIKSNSNNNLNQIDLTNVPTLRGDSIALQSEGKNTILYFFAPWCQICHVSIGNLQSLYQKNDKLDVIAISLDYTSKKEVLDFTNKHQLTFPIAMGNTAIKNTFEITGYPSYYVLNEDNVIIGKSMGYSSELGLYLRSL